MRGRGLLRRALFRWSIITAFLIIALLGSNLGILQAASVSPVQAKNPTCADYGLLEAYKMEGSFNTGTINVNIGGKTYSIVISAISQSGGTVTVASSTLPLYAIIVKASEIGNVYRYPNGWTGPAESLTAPINQQSGNPYGLSHISFCYSNTSLTPTSTPVTPTSTPITPTSTPITPTSTPVTPTSTPVTPTSTPVTPTSTPVTPTSTPVTPTSTPVTPTSTPITPTSTPATPVSSQTPTVPTATPTNTPTKTPVPPTATPTNTPGSNWVPTPTPVTPTATPVPTQVVVTVVTPVPVILSETPVVPTPAVVVLAETPVVPTKLPSAGFGGMATHDLPIAAVTLAFLAVARFAVSRRRED